MERELMPDYGAEEFYRYLIPENVFGGDEKPQKAIDSSVVSCKKGPHDLFDINKAVFIGGGAKNFFKDEVHMSTPSIKVVFLVEKD